MRFLIIVAILFAVLHLALLVKLVFAIILAGALTIGLWVLWRLKWVILALIGIEEIF